MGSKYVIELEDYPLANQWSNGDDLYRVKGFKSLVFDDDGLKRLTPLEKELEAFAGRDYERGYQDGLNYADPDGETYVRGLNDAWEVAREIADMWENDTGNTEFIIDDSVNITLNSMTAEEAIEKLKAYKESKIEVGDEVETADGDNGIVIAFSTYDTIWVMNNYVTPVEFYRKDFENVWHKTGRHFDLFNPFNPLVKESKNE